MIYAENELGGCHLDFRASGELGSLCGDDMIYPHTRDREVSFGSVCVSLGHDERKRPQGD